MSQGGRGGAGVRVVPNSTQKPKPLSYKPSPKPKASPKLSEMTALSCFSMRQGGRMQNLNMAEFFYFFNMLRVMGVFFFLGHKKTKQSKTHRKDRLIVV